MTRRYTTSGRELQEVRTATSNDLGEYRICDVPAGKYFLKVGQRNIRLNATAEDGEAYGSVYYLQPPAERPLHQVDSMGHYRHHRHDAPPQQRRPPAYRTFHRAGHGRRPDRRHRHQRQSGAVRFRHRDPDPHRPPPVAPLLQFPTTDASGKFTINGIAPGTYKLLAWDKVDNNAVMYDPDFLRPYESAAKQWKFCPAPRRPSTSNSR
jgi:hypothetical protein